MDGAALLNSLEQGGDLTGSMSTNDQVLDREALANALARCVPWLRRDIDRQIPVRFRKLIAVDDVLQDVWIDAFGGLATFIPDGPGAIERWLRRIAEMALLQCIRRARAAKRAGDLNAIQESSRRRSSFERLITSIRGSERSPSGEGAMLEAKALVHLSLVAIGPDSRRAVELRYLEGLSHQEIATRMGKTKAAVNSLLYRGLGELRLMLGQASRFFSDG